MKNRIVPILLVLSAIPGVLWLVLPHGRWLDREDLPYLELVKADLARVVAAQDTFLAVHGHYARSLDSLPVSPAPDVTIELTSVTASGFVARGSNAQSYGECAVAVGSATAPIGGADEGEPVCR